MKPQQQHFVGSVVAIAALLGAATAAQAQSAGQWLAKVGINNINPQVKSGDLSAPSLAGTKNDVKDATSVIVTGAYMLTDNVSVEAYAGLPYKHDIVGDGEISGVGKLGTVKQISPTVFGQYRFNTADAMWRPYVGLGLTFTHFYDEQGNGTLTALTNTGGTPTRFSIDNAWGVSPQVGMTARFNERWFADLTVTKTYIKTKTSLSTGQTIDTRLDPLSIGLSIGYRF